MGTKNRQNTGRTERLNARVNPAERLDIDLSRGTLSIADFVVLCSFGEFRAAVVNAGWSSIPEFIEALASGSVKMPTKPPQKPSGEML